MGAAESLKYSNDQSDHEIVRFLEFLRVHIESHHSRQELLSYRERGECVGLGAGLEGTFTRKMLTPAIAKYFYEEVKSELELDEASIKSGLLAEGFKHCPGFGGKTARQIPNLLTKGQMVSQYPPKTWFKESTERLAEHQTWPDFAISEPLPFKAVGEVKLFEKGSSKSAVLEIYNAVRQAYFYLGVMTPLYDRAIVVVADASGKSAVRNGVLQLKKELIERFGWQSKIHFLAVELS